jgi:hypothetical protein
MRVGITRILALCIVAGAFVPFVASKTPSTALLVLYGALIAVYLVLARIIRFSWKRTILLTVLSIAGILAWNIASVLPPVVFVFFIAFLVPFLSALYLIALLQESRRIT